MASLSDMNVILSTRRIVEYQIVPSWDVMRVIQEGWQPYSSPAAIMVSDDSGMGYVHHIYQAVVKHASAPEDTRGET